MGLESILSEIENTRKQRIDSLRKEYDRKTGEHIISMEKQMNVMRSQSAAKLVEEIKALQAKHATMLEIEEKKIHKERTDSLVSEALLLFEEIASSFYKTKEYKKLLTEMVNIARDLLGKDCKIFSFADDVESLAGTKGIHKMQKSTRFTGGIFASSADGKKELDLTMDTIMNSIRENLIAESLQRIGGK